MSVESHWHLLWCCVAMLDDWLKNLASLQLKLKPKPVVARSYMFSRAFNQLYVFTPSFDCFTGLSLFFVIGQRDHFDFGFTTLW